MKKTAIFSLSLLATLGAFAQAKLDAGAIEKLSMAKIANAPAARSGEVRALAFDNSELTSFFVTVTDESDIDELINQGFNVMSRIDDMAIVSVTAEELIKLAENPLVKKISGSEMARTLVMDARVSTGVDAIHGGPSADAQLPASYTGKGVIVGMMDSGLDINHVNFLKDVDATGYFTKNPGTDIPNRASRVWWLSPGAVTKVYDTPEKIAAFDTDNGEETHGTHVLGIAAGSFRGRMNAPTFNQNGGNNVAPKANPFYGVAYEADLAVAAGTLEGTNINTALKYISEYAESVGKPVAMNLSLGHNIGPHDGTTDANLYMDKIGENMIICVSAGNEGDLPICLEKNLAAGSTVVKTCLGTSGSVRGTFDLWSSDSEPLTLTFVVMDKETGNAAWTYKIDLTEALEKQATYYLSGTYFNAAGYDRQDNIDKYFSNTSGIYFTPSVNANNNRYNIRIGSQLSATANNSKRYIPALYIEGKAGKHIALYGNSVTALYDNGFSGFSGGSNNGSINDMACAKNVIAVGAYVNKTSWPINGNNRTIMGFNGVEKGDIAYFSSFGTTYDGRQLPHITAPGMGMISSMSHYYYSNLKSGDSDYEQMVCSLNEGTVRKRSSYWVEMSGTSMAAPFVTGVIALWLEADPTLSVDDAKKILKETAIQDEFTAKQPERWGYGKIDALAGIKKVLGITSGINDVASEGRDILINQVGSNSYDLFCAGASEIKADLYSISGAHVASKIAAGDNLVFTPEADHGIYILRVTAGDKVSTQKVTLR